MSKMSLIHIPADDGAPITILEVSQEDAFDKIQELVGYSIVVNLPEGNDFAPNHQMYIGEGQMYTEKIRFNDSWVNNAQANTIMMDSAPYVSPLIGDVVLTTRPTATQDEEGNEDMMFPLLSDEVKLKILSLNN